jgi:hypothetical protein
MKSSGKSMYVSSVQSPHRKVSYIHKNRSCTQKGELYSQKSKLKLALCDHKLVKRVYLKVSGLATWSKKCKWYSSLPLGAVVSPFCEPV